jgi:hypothetical protein
MEHRDRVQVHTHDLVADLSPLLLQKLGAIDAIVHFAAESHVDRSITGARKFFETNVIGMLPNLFFRLDRVSEVRVLEKRLEDLGIFHATATPEYKTMLQKVAKTLQPIGVLTDQEKNSIIDQKPNNPTLLKATAQGKRKATSRSKMIKRMDTR